MMCLCIVVEEYETNVDARSENMEDDDSDGESLVDYENLANVIDGLISAHEDFLDPSMAGTIISGTNTPISGSGTPTTKYTKYRTVRDLTEYMKNKLLVSELPDAEKADAILKAVMKVDNQLAALHIMDAFKTKLSLSSHGSIVSLGGRPGLSMEVKSSVWEFYHTHSKLSTDTKRPAKVLKSKLNKLHDGLPLSDHVDQTCENKRKKAYFSSPWRVLEDDYKVLYKRFRDENPGLRIGKQRFIELCPFYVKKLTRRDLEVCLCQTHTNFRNCCNALCEIEDNISHVNKKNIEHDHEVIDKV